MSAPIDSTFISVGLELRSSGDLESLRRHFRRAVHELHYGEFADGFLLVVEPVIDGKLGSDALRCTDELLALLEAMPPALRILWERCDSRRFDYGFEGGVEGRPCAVVIDVGRLRRLAAFGIEIGMTLYPFSAPSVASAAQRNT